jgi:hypothetical protein
MSAQSAGRVEPEVTREPDAVSMLIPWRSRTPYVVSAVLGVAAAAAAALTLVDPGVLTGVPGANGNMLGTAAVVLLVGAPLLALAMIGSARGSSRAFVVWLGTLGYLLYQAVLFCFATPLNNLFLFYVAYLSLAIWSVVFLLGATSVAAFRRYVLPGAPTRLMAGYALVLVALNATAWLKDILPAVFSERPRAVLADSGLLTNPVAWGQLATAAILVMFVLESISISVDQWFGYAGDPTSRGSALVMVPAFAVVAAVTAVPLGLFLRSLGRLAPRSG